jgi:hypothetical protein
MQAQCRLGQTFDLKIESGQKAVISYAKGLIIMLFPWLAYILSVIVLTGRFGLIASLVIGVSLYILTAFLT